MHHRRPLLLAFATVVLGVAALACNGRVTTDDPSGSTSSKSQKGDSESASKGAASSETSVAPAKPACDYDYASSSSSSGGSDGTFSCESAQHYSCDSGPSMLTCSCTSKDGVWGQGSCSCNGLTFAFDCDTGCSPGAEEYAKCGLPAPDDSNDYGGSSTSSSSSSSGG